MQPFPKLMAEHGLDLDADERAVKRAYAKDLKRIDREADPAGFQTLRESYEYALNWLQHRDWQKAQEVQNQEVLVNPDIDQSAMPEPVDTSGSATISVAAVPETPADLAEAVFVQMLTRIQQNLGSAAEELQAAMDDSRLIQLEARTIFEWMVAAHLGKGWQVGNGDLFGAAIKCFQWDKDSKRLQRFGGVGMLIDRALNELAVFNQLDLKTGDDQINLIRNLRLDIPPSEQYVFNRLYIVEDMMRQYPNWMPLVTSRKNIEAWREVGKGLDWAKNRPPELKMKKLSATTSMGWRVFGMLVFWTLIWLFNTLGGSKQIATPTGPLPNLAGVVAQIAPNSKQPTTPEDMFIRGEDYLFGRDRLPLDASETVRYWSMAADRGYLEAQLRLGTLYFEGRVIPKDYVKSLHWLLMAANQGNAQAQFIVAQQYQFGMGTAVDKLQAVHWYQMAADAGVPGATRSLATTQRDSK